MIKRASTSDLVPITSHPPPSSSRSWFSFITWPQHGKRKRERLSTLPLSSSSGNPDQVQTITPVELSQVLADCECVAVALQPWGGPAISTAVTVTFCEGVKP